MFKDIFSQWSKTALTILLGFLLPRMMNQYLGTAQYGTWQSIVSLTGVVQLLALGVPMASVRFLSRALAQKDGDAVRKVVSTCTGLYLGVGLVALAVGAILVYLYGLSYCPKIPDQELVRTALVATAVLCASNALAFLLRFPFSIMMSYGYFVQLTVMNVTTMFIKTSILVAILISTRSILHIALLELVVVVGDFLMGYFFIRKRHPEANLSLNRFDRSMIAPVLGFGAYVIFLNMGQKLSFQIDSLVIGKAMSFDKVAFFTVCNTILVQLIEMMLCIASVIMPAAARLDAEGKRQELVPILLKWSKIAFAVTAVCSLFLLVAGPEFIGMWMNDPTFVAPAQEVLPILVLSNLVFLPVRAVAMPMLFGLGQVKKPALGFLMTGVVNLLLSILLVGPLGLVGVALGTALPNTIFSLYVLIVACRSVGMDVLRWFDYVATKCVVACLPVYAVLMLLKNAMIPHETLLVFALGSTTCALFATASLLYIFGSDPYVDLKQIYSVGLSKLKIR